MVPVAAERGKPREPAWRQACSAPRRPPSPPASLQAHQPLGKQRQNRPTGPLQLGSRHHTSVTLHIEGMNHDMVPLPPNTRRRRTHVVTSKHCAPQQQRVRFPHHNQLYMRSSKLEP